jgi:hypothetical protein
MIHLMPVYFNNGGNIAPSLGLSLLIWVNFLFICFYLIRIVIFYTKQKGSERLINYLFWDELLEGPNVATIGALVTNGIAFLVGGAILVNYLFF